MKTSIWAYDFPGSNRPKVLKSWKRAEKSARGVNERSGARKACAWRGLCKGLGWASLSCGIYGRFLTFSLIMLFEAPSPQPAGRSRPGPADRPAGRSRPAGAGRPAMAMAMAMARPMDPGLRIHGSQPPDPWIPASGSMDPRLQIHGSRPPDPWIQASGSLDPSLRILPSQPPDPRIPASGSMEPMDPEVGFFWDPWIRRLGSMDPELGFFWDPWIWGRGSMDPEVVFF